MHPLLYFKPFFDTRFLINIAALCRGALPEYQWMNVPEVFFCLLNRFVLYTVIISTYETYL